MPNVFIFCSILLPIISIYIHLCILYLKLLSGQVGVWLFTHTYSAFLIKTTLNAARRQEIVDTFSFYYFFQRFIIKYLLYMKLKYMFLALDFIYITLSQLYNFQGFSYVLFLELYHLQGFICNVDIHRTLSLTGLHCYACTHLILFYDCTKIQIAHLILVKKVHVLILRQVFILYKNLYLNL